MRRLGVVAALLALMIAPATAHAFTAEPSSIASAWAAAAASQDEAEATAWVQSQTVPHVAALTALAARTGALGNTTAEAQASIASTSTLYRGLYAMGQSMQDRGQLGSFYTAVDQPVNYLGMEWVKLLNPSYALGSWLGFQVAGSEPTTYTYGTVTSDLSNMTETRRTQALANGTVGINPAGSNYSEALTVCNWVLAVLAGDPHGSPVQLSWDGTYIRVGSQYGVTAMLINASSGYPASGVTGYRLQVNNWTTVHNVYVAGMAVEPTGGSGGQSPVDHLLEDGIFADLSQLTWPDVASLALTPSGWAMAHWETPSDFFSYAAPFAYSGSELGQWATTEEARLWLQGIRDDLAEDFGESWGWLSNGFGGVLGALQSILKFMDDAWKFVMGAFEVNPDFASAKWADVQEQAEGRFPFGLAGALTSVSAWAGAAAGGTAATEGMNLDWNSDYTFSAMGVDIEVDPVQWFAPLAGYRWLLQAFLWVAAVTAFVRMTRPVVNG